MVERGKGYLRLIFLEKEGALWFLSTINDVAREEDNEKFSRKFRDSQRAFLDHVAEIPTRTTWPLSTVAVGSKDSLSLQKKWGWCGFAEYQAAPVYQSCAQVVTKKDNLSTINSRGTRGRTVGAHRKVWPLRQD
jgi:hypothetical protein